MLYSVLAFGGPAFQLHRTINLMKSYMCVIAAMSTKRSRRSDFGRSSGHEMEDVPLSWRCPDCGAGKEDFEMIEV